MLYIVDCRVWYDEGCQCRDRLSDPLPYIELSSIHVHVHVSFHNLQNSDSSPTANGSQYDPSSARGAIHCPGVSPALQGRHLS